jgi:hypothetical protein
MRDFFKSSPYSFMMAAPTGDYVEEKRIPAEE